MRRLLIAIALLCSFVGLFAAVLWAALVWEIETIDPTAEVRYSGRLAVDANGYPHIIYRNQTNGNLKYAAWNGESWSVLRCQGSRRRNCCAARSGANWPTSPAMLATGVPGALNRRFEVPTRAGPEACRLPQAC